jgi:hypothetical protein
MTVATRLGDVRLESTCEQPVCCDLASTGWLDAGTVAQLQAHFASGLTPDGLTLRAEIVVRDDGSDYSRKSYASAGGVEIFPGLVTARAEQSQFAQVMRDRLSRIACCRRVGHVACRCRFIGARL